MAKPNRIEAAPVDTTPEATTPEATTPEATTPEATVATPEATVVGKDGIGATKAGNVVMLANGERRVDYIKRRFAEGVSRGAIAKDLGVEYQIVFAATKKPKEVAATAATGAAVLATAGAADAETSAA
jgi:hypothetical protein